MEGQDSPHSMANNHGRMDSAAVPRIEAYEMGWGTVIFDGENPLAWIASSVTVPLEQHA